MKIAKKDRSLLFQERPVFHIRDLQLPVFGAENLPSKYEAYYKKRNEYIEKDLGNSKCQVGDKAEPEQGGNQCQNQKGNRPF